MDKLAWKRFQLDKNREEKIIDKTLGIKERINTYLNSDSLVVKYADNGITISTSKSGQKRKLFYFLSLRKSSLIVEILYNGRVPSGFEYNEKERELHDVIEYKIDKFNDINDEVFKQISYSYQMLLEGKYVNTKDRIGKCLVLK